LSKNTHEPLEQKKLISLLGLKRGKSRNSSLCFPFFLTPTPANMTPSDCVNSGLTRKSMIQKAIFAGFWRHRPMFF
jgi:hypothetical protein